MGVVPACVVVPANFSKRQRIIVNFKAPILASSSSLSADFWEKEYFSKGKMPDISGSGQFTILSF